MSRSHPLTGVSSPRRFLLLSEESIDGTGQDRRIRRYRLTSVGRRRGPSKVDIATARVVRELARQRRM